MNSFGRLFRISIFGESHGESVGVSIDGCPAGLPLAPEDLPPDLERRKGGTQKGTTPRKEDDLPIFKSGLFNGRATGAPLTILFENNNTRSGDYEKQRAVPRPGHADFVAHHKFGGFEDYRGGGHFSGRLTVALVAAGVIAKKMLAGVFGSGCGGNYRSGDDHEDRRRKGPREGIAESDCGKGFGRGYRGVPGQRSSCWPGRAFLRLRRVGAWPCRFRHSGDQGN